MRFCAHRRARYEPKQTNLQQFGLTNNQHAIFAMTLNATLSLADLQLIKESLQYTKLKFEVYTNFPSPDFKQKRMEEATAVLVKINQLIKEVKLQ